MSRGKSTNNLKRSSENKNPRGDLLIVVEGEQTEYNYFDSLKRELKLSTIKIKVVSANGGDPLEIVNTAYDLYRQKQYDQVFCIFDDDNKPEKYKQALSTAKGYNKDIILNL
jgi:alcohol dehydrogenase class IV